MVQVVCAAFAIYGVGIHDNQMPLLRQVMEAATQTGIISGDVGSDFVRG